MDSIIIDAQDLLTVLDNFAYGFVDNATLTPIPESMADYKYRILTLKQLMRTKIGVCWDFALMEYAVLRKKHPDADIRCVFADFGKDGTPTHTFVYFKTDGGWVWMESAWWAQHGMHVYPSERELLSDFKVRFARFYKRGEGKVRVRRFVPDEHFYGLTPTEFKDKCLSGDAVRMYSSDSQVVADIRAYAKRIRRKCEADAKPPTGNQNCMLCTWCMERWFRGTDDLPRPVYSPTDPIFQFEGHEFVKDTKKVKVKSLRDIKRLMSEDGCRCYIHVNWKGRQSGHEFLLVNVGGDIYVVDGQAGFCEKAESSAASQYWNINWGNSFLMRIDGRSLDWSVLKYNSMKYLKQLDEEDMKILDG